MHFFRPRPYLLIGKQIKRDAQGKPFDEFTSDIIWLPDPSQEYVVEVESGWGTADGSVKLADGWMLTEFGGKTDSKGPETIAAIAGLVKEAAGVAALATTNEGLYRIDIDKDGNVTLTKQTGW